MKLDLPSVTLVCTDCRPKAFHDSILVMEKCLDLCSFGDVQFLTDQPTAYQYAKPIRPLSTLVEYSMWCLTDLYKQIHTKHMLVVQHDGWILNVGSWNPAWLEYDYIGPLFIQYPIMGTGGFSLRSQAIMAAVAKMLPENVTQDWLGAYEGGVISMKFRIEVEKMGFKYATLEEGAKFAQGGNRDPRYFVERPFGFHGSRPEIDRKKGVVSPWSI